MTDKFDDSMILEDVDMFRGSWRNFAGAERPFNRAGSRNFCIGLTDEYAEELSKRGYPVKLRKPIDPEDPYIPYVKVFVSYKIKTPQVMVITSRGKRNLAEEDLNVLDFAEVSKLDLTIEPYDWNVGEKEGRKAMVKKMYVTLVEDELDRKYYDVPDMEE